jgi:hypothetical protein
MASRILLAGAIRGLVSEGDRVVRILERERPDAVGLAVSPEGLEVMASGKALPQDQKNAANPEEEMYIEGLSEFGEVVKPPPCFSMAQQFALANKIRIEALDMDDEHYTAAYCKYVSTLDMIRQGNSRKHFARHAFVAGTPEEFVMEWDGLVNRLKSYRDLENAREAWFAKRISLLAGKGKAVLAVVELERLAGVSERLTGLGLEFETVH